MGDAAAMLGAALAGLEGVLASGHARGPIVEWPVEAGAADAEAMALELARRAGPGEARALFCGEGHVFAGLGAGRTAAARAPLGDEVRQLIGDVPGRMCVIAAPFPTTGRDGPPGASGSAPAPAWTPHLGWSWRAGRGVLSLDLDPDDGAGAAQGRARRFLARLVAPPRPLREGPLRVVEEGLAPGPQEHRAAVEEALARMAAGVLDKVVLARRRRLRGEGAAGDLALRLWQRLERSGPAEVRFLVGRGEGDLVGVTPELLCRRRGREAGADVLAGTAASEDGGLFNDPKERREHEAVRRFVVEALEPLSVEVRAPATPGLRRLRHLVHLHTPVEATLRRAWPVFDRLHPTPAVAGTPLAEALALIGRCEPFERGLYAGAIGLADGDGEEVWVALRCALVRTDGAGATLDLFAGSGLVPGAVPEREWRELDRKEGAVRAALEAVCGGAVGTGASDAA